MNRGNPKDKKITLPCYARGNWSDYDRYLVSRGSRLKSFLASLSEMSSRNWGEELESMNKGKRGRPYKYPESWIAFIIVIHEVLRMPLRMLEGFIRGHLGICPDSSTLSRRFRRIGSRIRLEIRRILSRFRGRMIEIAMDGTGIRLGGSNVWIEEKFGKRKRNFGKISLVVDLATGAILSFMAGRKNFHEGKHSRIMKLINEAEMHGKIVRIYADAAYAESGAIREMRKRGIDAVIKVRKSSIRRALMYGIWDEMHFLALAQSNWERWVKKKRYGKRSGIEGFIGSFKRIFGETSHAVKWFDSEMAARILIWNVIHIPST